MTVKCDKVNRHIKSSNTINIRLIDDEDEEEELTAEDAVVFSIDITSDDNLFNDNQLLLDTCAGESVFKTDTPFYDIVSAYTHTPMIISGANSKGEPMVVTQCGSTDFGVVYYDPNCIANILSFANMVNNCYAVSYIVNTIFIFCKYRKAGAVIILIEMLSITYIYAI